MLFLSSVVSSIQSFR